jgi:aldehyde dehydrogenase (NAD+)
MISTPAARLSTPGDSLLVAKGVFVANEWRAPVSGRTIDVYAPAEGSVFARISAGDAHDIDAAVGAARKACVSGVWGKLAAVDRGRLLTKLGLLVLDRAEELAAIEARDTGKPMKQARADIQACARYFEFYGGAADKFHGETIPFLNGYLVAIQHDPHGVTGHILPWNYPAQMFGRTLAPALAVGNAVVLKPAEEACLTPLRLAELAVEAGFPEGAINVVPGLGSEAGAALIRHPDVDFVSFTGSPEVGVLVQTETARNHIPCTLELGGKSAQVVFADVDLETALPSLVNAIVQNAGQTCSAGSRLLVERKGYDRIVETVADRFAMLQAGTPEMDLDLGPLISNKQKQRVERFCENAAADAIPLLAEGSIADGVPASGYFVAPKLFGPVPRSNALAREEVFGPVLSVLPYVDEDDAVALANGTDFGLLAGVWTSDAKRATRVARRLRAGQVYVNAYGAGGGIELPFGGIRKSGHGREKGMAALRDFSILKTIIFKHD